MYIVGSSDNVAAVYDETKVAIVIAIFVAVFLIILIICIEVLGCCRSEIFSSYVHI